MTRSWTEKNKVKNKEKLDREDRGWTEKNKVRNKEKLDREE